MNQVVEHQSFMEKIEIPWKTHKGFVLVLAAFFPFIFFASLVDGGSALVFFGIVLLPALAIYVWGQWANPVCTEIDPLNKVITRRYRTIFGRRRIKSYSLDGFRYIRSYLTIGRFPVNVVDLVTHSGGDALTLIQLDPSSKAKSFFSIPIEVESEKATAIRKTIASTCNLVDQGFLGRRAPGSHVN